MIGEPPQPAGPQIHRVDLGIAVPRHAHDDLGAVGREPGRKGHAGEIAEHLLSAGVDVVEIDPRAVADVGQEGDLLLGGREARRQHEVSLARQEAVVGAVLVHDRQSFDPAVGGPRFRYVDHARVEIAAFPGEPLVDLVGDPVGDHAPVGRRGAVAGADQLLLGEDIPQPELHGKPAVCGRNDRVAVDQRLGVDEAPVAKTRPDPDVGRRLDEGPFVDEAEQARPREVAGDHFGYPSAVIPARVVAALEIGDRDGQRLDMAACDVDLEFGPRRRRSREHRPGKGSPRERPSGKGQGGQPGQAPQSAAFAAATGHHCNSSLVSKLSEIVRHAS